MYARLDIYEDVVELEENLTEDEVDEALFEYVNGFWIGIIKKYQM